MNYRGGREHSTLLERARRLRGHPTKAEWIMWQNLRAHRFENLKFRRQHEFGNYIVDFYCEDLGLVIELDGAGHLQPEQIGYDNSRTKYLQDQHLTVTRIENDELVVNTKIVFDRLRALVRTLRDLK